MRKIISVLLILTLMLGTFTGCSNDSKLDGSEPGSNSVSEGTTNNSGERDSKTEYDTSNAVTIQLNGTSATAGSNSVQINGSTVIIKEEAT